MESKNSSRKCAEIVWNWRLPFVSQAGPNLQARANLRARANVLAGAKLRVAALFLLACSISACAERGQLPAKSFEGTITEVIQMPGLPTLMSGDTGATDKEGSAAMLGAMANMTVKMYVRPDKLAYDMSTLGGFLKVHAIIDRNTRKLTVLMPNKTAMVTDLRSFDSVRTKMEDSAGRSRPGLIDSLTKMLPKPTGKTQEIEGMTAEQYIATSGDLTTELWLSNDDRIKALDVVRDALLGRHRTGEAGGLEQAFAMMAPVAGKLPVKFETRYKGKVLMTGGLRDIEEGKVEDEQFEIPKDYQIISGDSMRATQSSRRPRTFTGPDTTE